MSREFSRSAILLLLCFTTVLGIPMQDRYPWTQPVALALGIAAAVLIWRDTEGAFRRRMGVLLGCVGVLALAPISTELDMPHFLTLTVFLLAVAIFPTVILRHSDPGVIEWRFLSRKIFARDPIYVAISFPLAWAIIYVYFVVLNPWMPAQWAMPAEYDAGWAWRLIIGINLVGVWDELFFINTVYGILRSLFPAQTANLVQAVIYTSVLNRMAFASTLR